MQLRGWCCTSVPASCADLIRIPYCSSVPRKNFSGVGEKFEKYGIRIKSTHDTETERQHQPRSLQPSQSLCYIRCTSTWWQHNCSLTVQTLYAIYILTPKRISGHVQNGRRANFSWPILYIYVYIFFGPTWAMASSFFRFLEHTQRRITVGRNPLDEWSARCRDLYLTTHTQHSQQTNIHAPVGLEPTISAGERPQTYALDRAATGTGHLLYWHK